MDSSNQFIVKGKTQEELREFFKSLGEPTYRALQLYQGMYQKGYTRFSEFTAFSKKLQDQLTEIASLPTLNIVTDTKSRDGTHKFTMKTIDGKIFESVWIPTNSRRTICVSSQAGCTLNCVFCATGAMKYLGSLKAWQILDQVMRISELKGEKPTHIVFMGMGEPMHNYFEVMKAAHIFHNENAFHIGAGRITISTAGVVTGIDRFRKNNEPFKLAVSLHHPDPMKRKSLMDVENHFPLDRLLKSIEDYTRSSGKPVTFEYIMIPEVNIDPITAQKLYKLCKKIHCKLNLIPMNTEINGWKKPNREEIEQFRSYLNTGEFPVTIRFSAGIDINGGCGMLAASIKNDS